MLRKAVQILLQHRLLAKLLAQQELTIDQLESTVVAVWQLAQQAKVRFGRDPRAGLPAGTLMKGQERQEFGWREALTVTLDLPQEGIGFVLPRTERCGRLGNTGCAVCRGHAWAQNCARRKMSRRGTFRHNSNIGYRWRQCR